jgi:membrane protease YdiL (CAAX protease family)
VPGPARRRRRWVVAATLVLGTAALAGTLAAPRGSGAFTALGLLAGVVWTVGALVAGPGGPRGTSPGSRGWPGARAVAVGAVIPGPGDSGGSDRRTTPWQLVGAVAVGVAAYLAFAGAALVVDHLPVLDGAVDSALNRAEAGPLAAVLAVVVLNAVGEELFFRGALPLALGGERRAAVAVAVYVLVTVAMLNAALVVAAAVMGTLFMVERLATGAVVTPAVTHVTWSVLVLLALPR